MFFRAHRGLQRTVIIIIISGGTEGVLFIIIHGSNTRIWLIKCLRLSQNLCSSPFTLLFKVLKLVLGLKLLREAKTRVFQKRCAKGPGDVDTLAFAI